MRRGWIKNRIRGAAIICLALAVGACTQRPQTLAPATLATSHTPSPSLSQVSRDPLKLQEVRILETAGQRSILFRFSQPPEGVDYFPLREPSRLVIDVKGPIESLPQVETYNTVDSLVSAVRIGSYQGRMRLVVDMESEEVPHFSVDNYDTLLTTFIGEKRSGDTYATTNTEVLFVADDRESPVIQTASFRPEDTLEEDTAGTLLKDSSVTSPERIATVPPLPTPTEDVQVISEPLIEPKPFEKNSGNALDMAAVSHQKPEAPAVVLPVKPVEMQEETILPRAAMPAEAPAPAAIPVEIAQASVSESVPEMAEPLAAPPPFPAREESPASTDFSPPPASAYTGTKISLDFKNADIHDVLRILADVSGLNIIATDDVKARVTLRLVEVPWDQALDVVLQANGLEKNQSGNVLAVSTARRLEEERKSRLAAQQAEQKLASLETVYLNINYVKATEVIELITREASGGASGGVALMSPRGSIAADSTSNVVIIRDTHEHIVAVQELVRNVDVQTPQVIIESYIVTASENLGRDLGIQWGYNFAASAATGNPTGVNFPGTVGVGGVGQTGTGGVPFIADFAAAAGAPTLDLFLGSIDGSKALNMRLGALEVAGKARIISRPRVVTINNTPAQIRNRREVRVPVTSGNTVIGGPGTSGGGDAFEQFDVGITLEVTPQISSDGYILLEISAESSELAAPSIPAGAGFPQIPDVLTRTASSNVLIQAGDTFVLGGILQDDLRQDERGIPYLRDTPGLGWLFRGKNRSQTKDELLVFITPRLTTKSSPVGLPTAKQLWERREREAGNPAGTAPGTPATAGTTNAAAGA